MPRKLTIKEVKERLKKVHGDIVILDESTYVNTHAKAKFIDVDYGEWWATPNSVIWGESCHLKRSITNNIKLKTLSIDTVIQKLYSVHHDIVTLDESTYKNTNTKAKFIDKDYGEWWSCPNNVINLKQKHPDRGIAERVNPNSLKIGEVKERIKKVFGDIVELDESTYTNTYTKARFIDKDYGEWWAIPKSVIKGYGHSTRANDKREQTCMKKYGTKNVSQNKDIKEKIDSTNIERYGTKFPSKNKKIKAKVMNTVLERYGVEHIFQSKIVRNKIKQTNLERYGVEYVSQDPEIALRAAKSQNNSSIHKHWKTNEEIVCVAGYEKATVEYFNANEIDYEWQLKAFPMMLLSGKKTTFRPDCYLPDQNLWIEIKGYFREDAKEKWDWFHKEHPNSELWNKEKLKEMKIL